MATFVVYEKSTELAYWYLDRSKMPNAMHTLVNLGSGLVAGMAAAIISQPADPMLSQINKTPAKAEEGICRRLYNIALRLGIRGSYSGIQVVMVSGMTVLLSRSQDRTWESHIQDQGSLRPGYHPD